MTELPNDVVGEVVPIEIGPVEADLEIHSFEHEWTTVTWKSNRVHVRASTKTSNRSDGILGGVEFTVSEDTWRELNRSVDTGTSHSGGNER